MFSRSTVSKAELAGMGTNWAGYHASCVEPCVTELPAGAADPAHLTLPSDLVILCPMCRGRLLNAAWQ